MRAAILESLTGPSGISIRDISAPDEAGRVLVDVHCAGVGFPDALFTRGQYQERLQPPFVPGYEVAGTVRSAPDGVGFSVGDRVLAFTMVGGFAEIAVADVDLTVLLPADMSFAEAIRLGTNYQTAFLAVTSSGVPDPGSWAMVFGAGGGLGSALVDVASALDLRTIAVASTQDKRDNARRAGALHTLPPGDALIEDVRRLTPHGVDLILDPVGGGALDAGVRLLAPFGELVVLGFASGAFGDIPANRLLVKSARASGVVWGNAIQERPSLASEIWAALLELRAADRLTVPQGKDITLDAVADAIHMLETRATVGKTVVHLLPATTAPGE